MATEASPAQSVPKKKKNIIRRIFWTTAGAAGTFYVGSTFLAFNNQPYYDFFSDRVPLGQPMLEFAESQGWDTLTAQDVITAGHQAVLVTQKFVTDTINGTKTPPEVPAPPIKQTLEKKVQEVKPIIKNVANETKTKIEKVAEQTKQESEKAAEKVADVVKSVVPVAQSEAKHIADEVSELVQKAEDALKAPTNPPEVASPSSEPALVTSTPPQEDAAPQGGEVSKDVPKDVYVAPLPIGFEPPPGFQRPAPKKAAPVEPSTVALPLVAPAVSSIGVSEPIITHLAGTIDNLASYLASNPAAASKVSDVLETAKSDLTSLADRIDKAREEERQTLEAKLDEQTREYTLKMMELEMEAQDKLDHQHEDFRQLFDEEKVRMAQAYREKLENELWTQTEIINERLKEEVIAQGIELQRRWIREIKVRVEQERGGRLGKLEELSSHLKRLERVALDNSTYLDDNIRVHHLWSAFRAVTSSSISSPVRKPFRDELRVLRHISDAREDPVVASTLESLESSQTPDIGVEPFADLATWFTNDVAPKVCHVALVPEENAGVLSYLASHLFSGLRFRRQGLVGGDDVLSVISRAEHYLNEKDLDSAARELNQLKGPAKVLLHDWLEAARRRLEVEQALEVVQTQATLASLLVI